MLLRNTLRPSTLRLSTYLRTCDTLRAGTQLLPQGIPTRKTSERDIHLLNMVGNAAIGTPAPKGTVDNDTFPESLEMDTA